MNKNIKKKSGKRRGRPPKNKQKSVPNTIKKPKKRGRKPKGGKVIHKEFIYKKTIETNIPNIILHLKCHSTEIENQSINKPFSIEYLPTSYIKKSSILLNSLNLQLNTDIPITKKKKLETKLELLSKKLHNNFLEQKSACFWCTYSFDNASVHIPKQERGGAIESYGCFCTPECAVAYLNKESIDSSTFWERYSLLNNLYGKIYSYKKNIKPAPNPYYLLNKFYGNMEIEEYRKLLKNNRILLVIDKPLTKLYPEIHNEDNKVPIINTNILNNFENKKYRLQCKYPKKSKRKILDNTFTPFNK